MTCVAFFGHDAADAAVRRRVQGFRDDGLDVIGFMMRREDEVRPDWENIDLGRTFDGKYAQRIGAILAGARRAAMRRDRLAAADVIYARNLDMLMTAFLARRRAGLKTPIIYECLDVHRLLTQKNLFGLIFRRAEGWLLRGCSRLVVSSPGFLRNHFEIHHNGRYRAVLIENKLAAGADYGPRPAAEPSQPAGQPLRIGWVGMLRCRRSFGLLLDLARLLKDEIRIVMHGKVSAEEIPDFHIRLKEMEAEGLSNVSFGGRYRAPEDLAGIYAGLDLVWAGDFMEAGANSVWLLPNRLYEGGFYAVPPIAPAGTETARWIEERGVGFTVEEDLASTLPALVNRLVADRAAIRERRDRLLQLETSTFVGSRGELDALISRVLQDAGRSPEANVDQFSTRTKRRTAAQARPTRAAGD